MINKIISIKGVGHFTDYQSSGPTGWNGALSKVNVIYAPNGSGKTTLSTVLKSLQQNAPELIGFKRSFGTTCDPQVQFKMSGRSGIVEFMSGRWNARIPELEVFDIHYIEDYLYSGSYAKSKNKTNLFKLLLGEKGQALKKRCKELIHKKNTLHSIVRKHKKEAPELLPKSEEQLKACKVALQQVFSDYEDYSKVIFSRQIEATNKYLERFTSYIRLVEFSFAGNISEFETFRIFLTLSVYGHKVQFLAPDRNKNIGNAKYSLSEGDKSAVALCFFLAQLEIQGVTGKIVVFDDPLSSFDYGRRNATVFQLARIASEAGQFFLLTHDLSFASEFTDKVEFLAPLNLKIQNDGTTSYISRHDIKAEFLTSTQKDIRVIREYLKNGAATESEQREVVRCIRPVLEGVIKVKYFDCIRENQWLGDIIENIRKAAAGDRLYKLRGQVDVLLELNDYSKRYHHATATGRQDFIDPNELRRYILLLAKSIDAI